MRQVEHQPLQPPAGTPITVTCKVTDPDGVASVELTYQLVLPGRYLPAFLPLPHNQLLGSPTQPLPPNPEFEDPGSWTRVAMRDDGRDPDRVAGNGVYTARLQPQGNRTLVRYRITAADPLGFTGQAPLKDDPSLNFAAFVYDGVPEYAASFRSVHPEGPGHVYSAELMNSLPVYILITRAQDLAECIAYNSAFQIPKANEAARDKFNWEGAFVYDHVRYRLRQANDRYGGQGKRSMRFRFNRGRYLRARDNYGRRYPTRWRTLNTGKMFDNKRVGNFGLTESMNHLLWNMVGAPAPFVHTFHFRVVTGEDEVPAGNQGQYLGDFWGMFLNFEDYDPRFLEAHDLEDGNLYKLKDGIFNGNELRRNQGRRAVTTDADFQNIRSSLRPGQPVEWLDAHVNYERWYPYHAVVEAVRHYDFRPADSHSKNRAWYFEPDYQGSELGRLWTLPWDSDASWGPNWNDGIDYSKNALFGSRGVPEYRQKYRNVIREIRDLLWTEETIHQMIDDLADLVGEFAMADRDRWRGAPPQAGQQDFGPMEAKVADMKRFAITGWTGSTGPPVPAGGRARHLDDLAAAEGDARSLPETPAVTSLAPEGFPLDGLRFRAAPFRDPQPEDTLAAMKWRLGDVTDYRRPLDRTRPRRYEWEAVWEREVDFFEEEVVVPPAAAIPGHTYRLRVKVQDSTGRWSHWSEPVEFTAGEPLAPIPQTEWLRITEIMYHPLGDEDYEFIELQNSGPWEIDLEDVSFRDGIEFSFAQSAVTRLGPGDYAVVVKNRAVFATRYGTAGIPIAGEYRGQLANSGERVELDYGAGPVVLAFAYDDGWYGATDGDGYSLVIRDPSAPRESWTLPETWRTSARVHGSPGAADGEPPAGLQLPGDADQTGRVNISDAVVLLRQVTSGARRPLPCGTGGVEAAGNRMLLDLDGDLQASVADGVFLLRYLFQEGPPPVLGIECVEIPGCPAACGR